MKPGRCGTDEYYDTNYAEAKDAGVLVGPYHRAFVGGDTPAEIRLDARLEAAVFIESVGSLKGGDLLPALDVETPFDGLDALDLQLWIRVWLRKVEAALRAKPIIYTNHSSWVATGDPTDFALAGHKLWVAQWEVRKPLVPAQDWAGKSWKVWQHSSTGSVDGIIGNVDLDVVRGGLGPIRVRSATPRPNLKGSGTLGSARRPAQRPAPVSSALSSQSRRRASSS